MDNPARMARTILFSTGIGLFLITFLALREERLVMDVAIGWAIPLAGILCLTAATLVSKDSEGSGLLSRWFPAMTESTLEKQMAEEMVLEEKERGMSGAWAALEESMLTEELGEDE